ncbi:hypothetical protein OUZ56_019242 [Daphnia magna]|uniref:Uncharacterized protein n=1 Tax=Daphnia magna TaxID=35525 RepID=A0ABQ9ZB18_9CRUS|nr:hypothetical protein OUZ56_019242 [Daphnia magna]
MKLARLTRWRLFDLAIKFTVRPTHFIKYLSPAQTAVIYVSTNFTPVCIYYTKPTLNINSRECRYLLLLLVSLFVYRALSTTVRTYSKETR